MKKFYFLVLATSLLNCSNVFGQHTPDKVVPGSKGQLPTITALPQGDGTILPVFYLDKVWSTLDYWSNSPHYTTYIDCKFTSADQLGGEGYYLEMLVNGAWVNRLDNNDKPYKIDKYNYEFDIYFDPEVSAYRLKMIGGPKDGLYSNVVEADHPSVPTSFGSGYSGGGAWNNFVGYTETAPKIYTPKAYGEEVKNYHQYLHYNWYRRNPNTYELTQIKNAHDSVYTFTIEDAGYDIISEIRGDGLHLDAQVRKITESIAMPINCSPEYLNVDGIIINSEYILPTQALKIGYTDYVDNLEVWKNIPISSIVEKTPGQYAIKADMTNGYYELKIDIAGIRPYYTYTNHWGDEVDVMMREAMGGMMEDYTTFVVSHNGSNVATTVDLMHINIDGEAVVDTTITSDVKETVVTTYTGQYIIRAHATDNTLTTYYPSAARWEDAVAISIPCRNPDTWNDSLFVLTLLDKPAPMTGQGVIEGKLNKERNAGPLRAMNQGANEFEEINVLLYNDKGILVATTTITEAGTYRFENVPYGLYTIVIDAVGYTTEASPTVTVSSSNPTVSNVDYTITSNGTIVSDNTTGIFHITTEQSVTIFDLQGRRIDRNAATQGLYIHNGRKFICQ